MIENIKIIGFDADDTLWQNEDPASLAGAEALWAAVLFPGWVASMDGTTVPFANLAAYQFNLDAANEEWSNYPSLIRFVNDRQVGLSANWVAVTIMKEAAPRVREL